MRTNLKQRTLNFKKIEIILKPDGTHGLVLDISGRDSNGKKKAFTGLPTEHEEKVVSDIINIIIRELRFLAKEDQI